MIKYHKILFWTVAAIFAIAPFYTPLTVWAASHLEHFDFFRIWKEIAISALALAVIGFLAAHRKIAVSLIKLRVVQFIAIYTALVLLIGAYDLITGRVDNEAVLYGWIINLRTVGFFGVVLLVLSINPTKRHFPWQKLVLIPASVVILFGFLQMTVLPADILTHIGYGKETTLPYGTVDNQQDLVRIQSTLRGPNPLGAYLLLIISVLTAIALKTASIRKKFWLYGGVLVSLIVLIGTYSRSAALGLVLSLVVLYVIHNRKFINRHIMGVVLAFLALTVVGLLLLKQNSYLVENYVLHTSRSSTAEISSNEQRLQALAGGIEDVIENPLGDGVGSAGPASLRNEKGQPRIAENYYIQLAQEMGVIAPILFLAINIVIGFELWKRRSNFLALALLSSLVGITFVNMLSHAWADDTLAYIWWGLAGVALAPAILRESVSGKKHAKTDKKTQKTPNPVR